MNLREFKFRQAQKTAASVSGRPELGLTLDPIQFQTLLEHLESEATALAYDGGVLMLSYPPVRRRDAIFLLYALWPKLHRLGRVTWLRPWDSASALMKGDQDQFLIVEDAPLFPDLEDLIDDLRPGTALIAAGDNEAWGQAGLEIFGRSPMRLVALEQSLEAEYNASSATQQLTKATAESNPTATVTLTVAAADGVGALLPVPLLARVADVTADVLENIIYHPDTPIFPTDPLPGSDHDRVGTQSHQVAWQFISAYHQSREEDLGARYRRMIEVAHLADDAERLVLLRICQGLARRGRYVLGQSIMRSLEKLRPWLVGSKEESAAWVRAFTNLLMFREAEKVALDAPADHQADWHILYARAYNLGRWSERDTQQIPAARSAFQQLYNQNPHDARTKQHWAVFEFQTGGDNQWASDLLRDFPQGFAPAAVAHAHAFYRRGEFERALNQLAPVMQTGNLYAVHLTGVIRAAEGAYAEADGALGSILLRIPHHHQSLHALAITALRRGHLAEASDTLAQGLTIRPEDPMFLHARAGIEEELGEYQRAAETLDLVLKIDVDNIRAWVSRGVLEAKRGNQQEAERQFRAAIALSPNNPWAYVAWANALMKYHVLDLSRVPRPEILDLLAAADNAGGSDHARLVARARYEATINQAYDEARIHLERALDGAHVLTDRIKILNTWGEFAAAAGKVDEAAERFEDAYRMDEENAFTLRALGGFLIRKGTSAEARQRGGAMVAKADEFMKGEPKINS